MKEINKSDRSEIRRQKKRQRNTQKFIGFVAIITLLLGLYVSKERWMPNMKHESTSFTGDEISGDGFPLKISNSSSYDSCNMGDMFTVLTDTRLYIFSSSGDLRDTRQHTYSNTIMKSAGGKVLVYEQNGNNLRVDNRKKMLYEKKLDDTIYLAAVSNQGYSAVVSSSDRYVCELRVFDHEGSEIYYRGCSERITDVVFNKESSGCSIVSIGASEGNIVTDIISVEFGKSDNLWHISGIEACSVSAMSSTDGSLVFFGDVQCGLYSAGGDTVFEHRYNGELIDVSAYDSKMAMVVDSNERRKDTLVLMGNSSSGVKVEVSTSDSVKHICAAEDRVYVLTESTVEAYDYSGKIIKTYSLTEPYRDFYKSGKYIMLKGHNKIDRIEF
ncbi:MAG: hypothetical protein E7505_09025 [Ruminococcus sp.]|nr:hypothetical protein [Ruminococcus sp.]